MAGTKQSWGAGRIKIAGTKVSATLDFWTQLSGVVSADCNTISWDNKSEWLRETPEIHTVHAVFMNHLDVGYNGIPATGFINNVLNTCRTLHSYA